MSQTDRENSKNQTSEADVRKARLSEALRNNLRRRKVQVRGRKAQLAAESDGPVSDTGENAQQTEQDNPET